MNLADRTSSLPPLELEPDTLVTVPEHSSVLRIDSEGNSSPLSWRLHELEREIRGCGSPLATQNLKHAISIMQYRNHYIVHH